MYSIYLNNFSGVSGDILLSALLQLVPLTNELNGILSKTLGFPVTLTLDDCSINGIAAKKLNISVSDTGQLNYRNIDDIKVLIDKSPVDKSTKEDAKAVVSILAEAESIVHNVPLENVHFHELGAVDTIIDILGVSFLINTLKPANIIASPIKVGSGFIKTCHGIIPNPAPASLQILKDIAIEKIDIEKELTTPTGAALIKYFAKEISKCFNGMINGCFYSTGTNVFKEMPNLFCLIHFKEIMDKKDSIIEIETNIDDMPGLNFSFVQKKLLEAGALDAYFTPVYTKKNRPAYKLNVLCLKNALSLMSDIIFNNTTTAGIRYIEKNRITLKREINTINYMDNNIRIKSLFYNDRIKKMPEWDDVEKAASNLNMPPYALYVKILDIL